MINRIFWDIDETLIHSEYYDFPQKTFSILLDDGEYFVAIRPCAQRLIEFSRELVGKENVHILTTARKDYAELINEKAGWGFSGEDILSREIINAHTFSSSMGYCSFDDVNPHIFAHKDNILIDNLPPRENQKKIALIGIWPTLETNYFQIRDWYGVNFPNDPFENQVKTFLMETHND